MQRFPMTPAGLARMQSELQQLRTVDRPAISKAIEEAREHGDLKENAEYHAAKDQQGLAEARIRMLETKSAMAQVIDPLKLQGPIIRFGATVRLHDNDTDKELTYQIVGEDEADFRHGLINYQSPIARGLMGKEEGDDVDIETAGGGRSFEILGVEYKEILLPERK